MKNQIFTLRGVLEDPLDSFFTGVLSIEGDKDETFVGVPLEEILFYNAKYEEGSNFTLNFIHDEETAKKAEQDLEDQHPGPSL